MSLRLGWFSILFFVVLLAACNIQPLNPEQTPLTTQANYWQQVGGIVATGSSPSTAVDPINKTLWIAESEAGNIIVRRWNDSSWQKLGSNLDIVGTNDALKPSLVLDSSGNPVIAWLEAESDGTNYHVYVKRWNGSAWVQLGNALDGISFWGDSDASKPSLVLNGSNQPIIAFEEFGTIFIKRWDGSSWVSAALSVTGGQFANVYAPKLALDSSGNLVLAYIVSQDSLIANSIAISRWKGSAWESIGNVNNSGRHLASTLALTLDNSNNPIVAWGECNISPNSIPAICSSSFNDLYVKQWTGSSWVQQGATRGPAAISTISLAISGNNPIRVWEEETNIYVQQWNGSSWITLGNNPLDTTLANAAYYPSLALAGGNLVVAWQEGSRTSGSIYVKQFLTNAWFPLGGTLDVNSLQSALNPSLVRKSNNNPIAAWEEGGTSKTIYVKEWTGNRWSALGSALDRTLTNDARNSSIAVKSNNLPTVAWQEGNAIYVSTWTSLIWSPYGGAINIATSSAASNPSLAIERNTDNPIVAWAENGNIYVKHRVGSSWLSYNSSPLDINPTNPASFPSLATDGVGNPFVAWQEHDGISNNIYVKRWTGSAWVTLGEALDRSSSRNAEMPSLAVGTDGNPVVTWQEAGSIFVKRWTGTNWVSLKGALDKIITNTASLPSLTLQSDNQPIVAWQELNGLTTDVLVKRWTGSTWEWVGSEVDKSINRNAGQPAIAIRSDNNPIIIWNEYLRTFENNVYVSRF